MHTARRRAFSLPELLVIIAIVGVGFALYAVAAEQQTEQERRQKNATQIRGIHQAQVMFAQANRSWFTGIGPDGEVIDVSTEYRLQVLLQGNFFMPDYVVSPAESTALWEDGRELTHDNYSFALLDIHGDPRPDDRYREWCETLNSQAAVITDRNTGLKGGGGLNGEKTYTSIWSNAARPGWWGFAAFNDNSVKLLMSPEAEKTRYARGPLHDKDHLFEAEGDDEALMTFSRDDNARERTVALRPRDHDAE